MSASLSTLSAEFGWQIERKSVKNINFRVHAGVVKISLPRRLDELSALRAILARKDWLEQVSARQLQALEQKRLIAANAAMAREFSFFGQMINASDIDAELSKLKTKTAALCEQINADSRIKISEFSADLISAKDFKEYKKLIYKNALLMVFSALASAWCAQLGVSYSLLKISRAKRIWGSCHKASKVIKASLQLATQPLECVSYVALHECAHLIHAHHQAPFWSLIKTHMSDYERFKAALKTPADFDI